MTQEFVTLPCEVVEQALEALKNCTSEYGHRCSRCDSEVDPGEKVASALRAALEQPQDEQPLRYLDGGSRYKVTHMKTSGYCIIGLPGELLGRWVALVDATDNKHMDSYQQPPTTEQSSAVQQPQAEQPAMTPIAQRKLDSLLTEGYTISGYSVYHEQKHQHGFVTGAGLVGWWKPDGVEYPQPRGEQEPVAEGDMVDPVSVPRGLLGAACFAIDHKRDAPKLLEKLRRYTVGDLSGNAAPQPPATPGEPSVAKVIGTDERGPMLLWHRAWTDFPNGTQLYTSPQPKREPLTNGQINRLIADGKIPMSGNPYEVFRAAEAAHNIK